VLASRLLSILIRLQTHGRMTAPALAREFGVSVRTIHRDIDQLSAAGIPVYADRGRSGGFQLMDGYRTELTGLTQPEAEALFLAGLPGPAAQLGLSDLLQAARLKLVAALPARMQPGAERIASRFHLDPVSWFRRAEPLPSLQPLARAVWGGHYVTLRYRRATEASSRPRRLGPLGLVLKGGTWYLVAQSGKAIRTYRVSGVQGAEVAEEPFARPRDFDLAAYWQKASGDYERDTYRRQAEVKVSPPGRALLELLGPHVVEAAARTAGPADRRGWVTCTLPVEAPEYAVRELMRLGAEAEVLGPPELREAMVAALAATAGRYR
jgi:predicted DNA-binding transcriptional regulator YafY